MSAKGASTLLDVAPELGDHLHPSDRDLAARLRVAVVTLDAGPLDVERLLGRAGCFGAMLVEGQILHRTAIGPGATARLLGPGDVLMSPARESPGPPSSEYRVTVDPTRIVELGERVARAARHMPSLLGALQMRMGEQHQRLIAQMGICQLSRVEDRLLAIMWMLADTWGYVGPEGTVLRLSPTHEVLGELVGARRPTVTLALGRLTRDGALARRHDGWLLLAPAPYGKLVRTRDDQPLMVAPPATPGPDPRDAPVVVEEDRHATFAATIAALRDSHRAQLDRVRAALEQSREMRLEIQRRRERRSAAISRPATPSSG